MRWPWGRREAPTILVLFHESCRRRQTKKYAVSEFLPLWERMGYRVVVQRGIRRRPRAELLFVHVDLTVIPEDYREFIASYPRTVNGRVTDIRKRALSTLILSKGEAWDGPVIVKSDLNCNGDPDARGTRDEACRFGGYLVFDHPSEVPEDFWHHPHAVVEKFLPEREGDAYCLREYVFFGQEEVWLRLTSGEPVIKGGNASHYERIAPESRIRELRHRLGFDYGTFDYVVHDGAPVLLDANRTQGTGLLRFPEFNETLADRAAAVRGFLNGVRRDAADPVS